MYVFNLIWFVCYVMVMLLMAAFVGMRGIMKKLTDKEIMVKYSCQPHQVMDYQKREKNMREEKALCSRCSGTGNELYSMYSKCTACEGTGEKVKG